MQARRINPASLVLHAVTPCMVFDTRTGKHLRLDGWWKTSTGRTLFAACSSVNQPQPGSILRRKDELETARTLPAKANAVRVMPAQEFVYDLV